MTRSDAVALVTVLGMAVAIAVAVAAVCVAARDDFSLGSVVRVEVLSGDEIDAVDADGVVSSPGR
jgi:hypothetical protein